LKIKNIELKKILNSKGKETIQSIVTTEKTQGTAASPSGTSAGKHEKNHINWETTEGIEKKDQYYIDRWNISDKEIEKGYFLQNLTDNEVLGIMHFNVGEYWRELGDDRKALFFYENALALNQTSYIPPDMKDDVIANTLTIEGGEETTIIFEAPKMIADA